MLRAMNGIRIISMFSPMCELCDKRQADVHTDEGAFCIECYTSLMQKQAIKEKNENVEEVDLWWQTVNIDKLPDPGPDWSPRRQSS